MENFSINKHFLFLVAFNLVFCASVSPVASADTEGESVEKLFELTLEEFLNVDIVSVSKKSEKSFTAPGTVYVVTKEMIDRYGFRTLQDALRYVPSVYLYDPQSWVWGGQRGFVSNFSQTLLLVNGREVNNLIAGEGFISHQFGTQAVRRIEVVASPASALYGANALAGVINVITRDADPQFEGMELSLETGSNKTTVANILFGKSMGNLSLKGSIRYHRSDEEDFLDFVTDSSFSRGWLDQNRARPFITGYKNESEATTVNLQLDFKGFYAGLTYYKNRQSHGLEKLRWDYTDGEDERRFSLFFAGYESDLNEMTHLKIEYQAVRSYLWGSYDSALWPVARLQAPEDTPIYRFPDVVTASTGQVLAGDSAIKGFYDTFAHYLIDQGIIDENSITQNDIENYFQHIYSNREGKGNRRHRFDVLFSREFSGGLSIDTGFSFDYIDIAGLAVTDAGVGLGATTHVSLDASRVIDVYESAKYGLFGQFQYAFLDDKAWLTVGARYDNQEHYGEQLSQRLGLVWQPTERNTIKLLYGEAFREPNIFELSSDSGLKPAVLKSYEIVIAHGFGNMARIRLTGYHSIVDNFLGSVGSLIGAGVGAVKSQIVQGVEWQADIQKGAMAAFINGAYVFNAEQDLIDPVTTTTFSRELMGLPTEKINIGVSYQFTNQFSLSLISSHIGAYDALSGNSVIEEPIKINTYHNMKLTLGIVKVPFAGRVWDGFITIDNLTDRMNYEANIRRSGPNVLQKTGRQITAGVKVTF